MDEPICAPIKIKTNSITAITINTANTEGTRFVFNHKTAGAPSKARKNEISNNTTTDCARFIPAIIMTIAAVLIRIRIPRVDEICSIIKLPGHIFLSFKSEIIATAETK